MPLIPEDQDLEKLTKPPTGECDRCERAFPRFGWHLLVGMRPTCSPLPARPGRPPGSWFCSRQCFREACDEFSRGKTREEARDAALELAQRHQERTK